ncbi:stimulator of interferon genes protein isoform X1 [Danio rerio]|uniref:Stimulator of interferon genes protein n=1 Tax=Danio rerio TaxID=7955 RepID=STING_DANRE|nr:stimulator of interferon genes protein isoform X1 [Danio rerio]E7F4N7.1 RecName: Full=Stimulator of interferon genes protein; Short=STING; AltName: Full=Transmembrane protein 173 [Danio rerio]|eukprot:XP_005157178.1 stimulator of interferon genes protein isoform X1 [Danio rerio]
MSVMGEDALVPRARSRLPVMCAAGLGFLTLAVAWLLDSDKFSERAGIIAFGLMLERFIYCICLLAEELLFHSRQRYHGRMSEIFRACFRGSGILGMCAIFLMLMLGGVSFSVKQWSHFNLMCAGYMLLNSLGVLGPAPVEISEICEAKKMNVAHGLAWSFYIGYLKFLLPALEVNVREYSRRERLSSPRLHILLPLNARVPSKPEEEDTNVVFHENLPDLKLDRAGVRKRSYTNSVYKITHNNETFSCILEYATPLLTLYQMSQESSAGFGERERKQQVLLFYRTLSQILDNSLECRNRYRLILLNDEHTGDPHYLSRELFQNLKQQDGEIFMDPTNEVHPVPEEGPVGNCNGALQATFHEEPMSDEPTLMFSRPQSLRSEPVETTDYFNPSSAMKQN